MASNESGSSIKRRKILSWILRLIILSVILCFALYIWIMKELVAKPMCDDLKSGMTKEEKILLGLKYANSSKELVFELADSTSGKPYLASARQMPYSDIAKILSQHPDCCRLVVQGSYDSNPESADKASEDVQGEDEGTVLLRYPGKYIGGDEKIHEAKVFWHADLNHCKN